MAQEDPRGSETANSIVKNIFFCLLWNAISQSVKQLSTFFIVFFLTTQPRVPSKLLLLPSRWVHKVTQVKGIVNDLNMCQLVRNSDAEFKRVNDFWLRNDVLFAYFSVRSGWDCQGLYFLFAKKLSLFFFCLCRPVPVCTCLSPEPNSDAAASHIGSCHCIWNVKT